MPIVSPGDALLPHSGTRSKLRNSSQAMRTVEDEVEERRSDALLEDRGIAGVLERMRRVAEAGLSGGASDVVATCTAVDGAETWRGIISSARQGAGTLDEQPTELRLCISVPESRRACAPRRSTRGTLQARELSTRWRDAAYELDASVTALLAEVVTADGKVDYARARRAP